MMISRQTMEKFVAAYPEYMYRPDHVRTEHFDGSRKIIQAFQAEIDRYDPAKDYKKFLEKVIAGEVENPKEEFESLVSEVNKKIETSTDRYLSEDYWFSQKSNKIGLKTWLCPCMKTNHTGTMIFGGSLIDLASIGASPTANPELLGKKKK
jgi:hypothetical protein